MHLFNVFQNNHVMSAPASCLVQRWLMWQLCEWARSGWRAVVMVLTQPILHPAGLHKDHWPPTTRPPTPTTTTHPPTPPSITGGPSTIPSGLWKQILRPIDQRHKNNIETVFPLYTFFPTHLYILMLGPAIELHIEFVNHQDKRRPT